MSPLVPVLLAAARAAVGVVAEADLVVDAAGAPRDRVEAWTWARAFDAEDAGRGRWRLELRALHVARGDAGFLEFSPGPSGWTGRAGALRVSAGVLGERWGRLDLLPVADVVDGRERRAGPLVPAAHARLPAPLLRVGAARGGLSATLAWLPVGAVDRVDVGGGDWALVPHWMVRSLAEDAASWEGEGLGGAAAGQFAGSLAEALGDRRLSEGLAAALLDARRPVPGDPDGMDVALRLRAEGPAGDVALDAAWMRARQPLVLLDPLLAEALRREVIPDLLDEEVQAALADPVEVRWPRTAFGALEGAFLVGPVGVRLEAAAWSARPVPRRWMQGATSPAVAAGAGLDWSHGGTLLASLEVRAERLLAPPADPWLVAPSSLQAAAAVRARDALGRVSVELGGTWDLSFREGLARATASWRPADALAISLTGLVLGGLEPPPEDLAAAMEYGGGPLSYWGDGDAVVAGLTWVR